MQTYRVISAATCTLEIAGNPVGYIQNLDITCNYQMQKIKNLNDAQHQGFVKGFEEYTVTARRAFIEVDTMFGTLENISNLVNGVKEIGRQYVDLSDTISLISQITVSALNLLGQLPEGIVAIPDLAKARDTVERINSGTANVGEFFTQAPFDIKVKTSTLLSDIIPGDIIGGMKDIWILRDCKLNTRNISMDIGNVIMLENVQILARKLDEPMFAYYSNSYGTTFNKV